MASLSDRFSSLYTSTVCGLSVDIGIAFLTLSHVEPDGVTGGVWGGAGVIPGVVGLSLVDGEGGDGGVGGRHPELLPVLASLLTGGDRNSRGEVDHGVVVVPGGKVIIITRKR